MTRPPTCPMPATSRMRTASGQNCAPRSPRTFGPCWYFGRQLGEEQQAVRAATALLPTAISPFPAAAGFRTLTGPTGGCHPTRTRAGCCLYYAIRPAEACCTCPRTSDAERLRRLES